MRPRQGAGSDHRRRDRGRPASEHSEIERSTENVQCARQQDAAGFRLRTEPAAYRTGSPDRKANGRHMFVILGVANEDEVGGSEASPGGDSLVSNTVSRSCVRTTPVPLTTTTSRGCIRY